MCIRMKSFMSLVWTAAKKPLNVLFTSYGCEERFSLEVDRGIIGNKNEFEP